MGEVYVAFDKRLKRRVALKVLKDSYSSDNATLQRFKNEAYAASRLNHPNILTIFDIDNINGRYVIATELVVGGTLRSRLKRGPIDVNHALAIFKQIGSALIAAHKVGIIHRDIKPENIMLRSDENVKLLDFGIAKLLALDPESVLNTIPGVLVGTPLYMSPEQARGESVDYRTDIWSLGVVLYEMLTGQPPFTGTSTGEVIKSILEKEPLSFEHCGFQKEKGLQAIIRSMMAKDVRRRCGDIGEVIRQAEQIIRESDRQAQGHDLTTIRVDSAESTPPLKRKKLERKRRNTVTRVAILPFVNENSDEPTDYLSDGVTETIINNLSHLPQLRVISRSTVFRFKGNMVEPKQVGEQLNVDVVVSGTVCRRGTRLLMQVELVDVRDGAQLWGERYNRRQSDIFKIQENIATEISNKLEIRLTGAQQKHLVKRATLDEQAYLTYLRGRFHWNKRSHEEVTLSLKLFNDAIERDPTYALAYVGVADSYIVLAHQHVMPTRDAFSRAKAAAARALQIDAKLSEANTTLGFIKAAVDFDWIGSERAFKKALRLNPGYVTAHHWYSTLLQAVGRGEEAIAEASIAFDLDPLSTSVNLNLATCFFFAGRYDEAIERFLRLSYAEPGVFWTHYGLALVYRQLGRNEDAITELNKAKSLTTDPGASALVAADLAYNYGASGHRELALELIDRIKQIAQHTYISPCDTAVSYLGLGDKESALSLLEKAYENRDAGLMWLRVDPIWTDLRTEPRFGELLKRINLS